MALGSLQTDDGGEGRSKRVVGSAAKYINHLAPNFSTGFSLSLVGKGNSH